MRRSRARRAFVRASLDCKYSIRPVVCCNAVSARRSCSSRTFSLMCPLSTASRKWFCVSISDARAITTKRLKSAGLKRPNPSAILRGGPATASSSCERSFRSLDSDPLRQSTYVAFLRRSHACHARRSVKRRAATSRPGAYSVPAESDQISAQGAARKQFLPPAWRARNAEPAMRTGIRTFAHVLSSASQGRADVRTPQPNREHEPSKENAEA